MIFKHYITLIAFFLFSFFSKGQSSETLIEFKDLPFEKAIEKAQADNKLIFVDIYATWCGSCKKMKKYTYTDSTFVHFMNENFINLSYDYERGHGLEFVKKYSVDRWPSLFLMSAKGKVLNKTTGYVSPIDFLTIVKIIHQINYKKPQKDEE